MLKGNFVFSRFGNKIQKIQKKTHSNGILLSNVYKREKRGDIQNTFPVSKITLKNFFQSFHENLFRRVNSTNKGYCLLHNFDRNV